MHDAQNLFDSKTSYVGEWNIDEKLDSINAELIVIGIEHGNETNGRANTLKMINMVEEMPMPILSLLSKH
jgi:predicted alpha/beta superfamily hydrolase